MNCLSHPAGRGTRFRPVLLTLLVLWPALIANAAEPPPGAVVMNTTESLERAIRHLAATFAERYPKGKDFLARLEALKARGAKPGDAELDKLRAEALLANPLLDFDKLLLVRRGVGGGTRDARGKTQGAKPLGLPANWQGNCSLPRQGFDNEIAVLAPVRPGGKVQPLYRPERPVFVGDVDLHFDGRRMLFSSLDPRGLWQVFEVNADGTGLRQVTRGDQPDVDNYDACYLPSGKIIFCSTATMHGVPCVGGRDHVANLYVMDADGANVRQLCFDQDHNWCPAVMNDGSVIYTRWEYSDIPHYYSRLLFRMNPDGVGQMALYGSNSYWPNSTFYARPIPDDPTKAIAVISGHHGAPRMGELVLFDVGRGQRDADGVVQRIPGYGRKVDPVVRDTLVDGSWPKFLHPFPLSAEYFLVAAMPTPASAWGLYLVDVFDNMLCLAEEPGAALLEPIPFRATVRPPVIPERVNLASKEAAVFMHDVYRGAGLRGVPRGTVKALRVYAFHYGCRGLAEHSLVGIGGPWDVHMILGTVPVEPDGSALFKVPANVPVAVQPLDSEGRALQVMRSWYTAMPGEAISCVGCHERQSDVPLPRGALAGARPPSELRPWLGPARGFSFKRDVQPVLDHYCVGCHDGSAKRPDLRPAPVASGARRPALYSPGYVALHPYVRRPGPESDYGPMPPADYAANTSELVQMLSKGHHGVTLDAEAWQRLYTWIDLNVPEYGTWGEYAAATGAPGRADNLKRRAELRKLYAHVDDDPETIPPLPPPAFAARPKPSTALPPRPAPPEVKLAGWPLAAGEAREKQAAAAAGGPVERTLALDSVALKLVLVPAGQFVMGSNSGADDEAPAHAVKIAQPFWSGKFEITNEQYALFDPSHDSHRISVFGKDLARGIPVNEPQQPVVRVSWLRAAAFCQWLAAKTGERFALPTEAQWEYACRAGTATPMNYGAVETDYSKLANLADATLSLRAAWHPKDAFARDGANVSTAVGRYLPNAWGLHDMHGNVAEWTASVYKPYPYAGSDGRETTLEQMAAFKDEPGERWPQMVVRGGSWFSRAKRATSSFRQAYPAWQGVYDVGFRVVTPVEGARR